MPVDRQSILNSRSVLKAFLVVAGNIEANVFSPQMVAAKYLSLVIVAEVLGGRMPIRGGSVMMGGTIH